MKIKVEWERTSKGISEIEVDEDQVLEWMRDPKWGHDKDAIEVTAKDCFDWLQSGDDDVWLEQCDLERDVVDYPWGDDVELEGLAS